MPDRIRRVYEVTARFGLWDGYLRYTGEVRLSVTPGYYLLFETESGWITLGADGARRYGERPFGGNAYEICAFSDDEPEALLFTGQELTGEEWTAPGLALVRFSDFILRLCVYHRDSFTYADNLPDVPVRGLDRLLTRPCRCGGAPRLLLDRRLDWLVRCPRCGEETPHAYVLPAVLDAWNGEEAEGASEQ